MHDHRAAIVERLRRDGHSQPGPGSVSWTINREMIAVAGWGRAILLQLAHPSIAAGVGDHSSFRLGVRASLHRLRSTVGAMLAIMFGDADEMITAAAGINAIHDRVSGRVPGTARAYSAHDPELLRWVHVTLLDSILRTHEQLIAPLSDAERNRYCAEGAIMEALLGMPDGWLPRTHAHLQAHLDQGLASVAVTPAGRALAHAVLYPPCWYLAWPAFRFVQLLTIGSLPASIRSAYGFDWRPRDAAALARWTVAARRLLAVLPDFARYWPQAHESQPASLFRIS